MSESNNIVAAQFRTGLLFPVLLLLMVCCRIATAQTAGKLKSNEIVVVGDGKSFAEIIIGAKADPVISSAAESLQIEVKRRTGVSLPIVNSWKAKQGVTAILLGVRGDDPSLKKALAALGHKPVTAEDPGREGFLLVSGKGGESSSIVVNGCEEIGVTFGVGKLLRQMRFVDGNATCPEGLKIATAPVMPTRDVQFGDHAGWVNTDVAQWEEVWRDFQLWGMNQAHFRCDPAHQGDPRETDVAKYLWQKWAERLPIAKRLGLKICHITQVNLVAKDGEFGPASITNFSELNYMCPDFNGINPKFPRGMDALMKSRKWFFDNMPGIDKVDYFTFSGWDGGGCKDPDVAPWSVTVANLVEKYVPLIRDHNTNAEIILRMYWVPDAKALAEKLKTWRPKWLNSIQLNDAQVDLGPLFPKDVNLVFFPLWTTMNTSGLMGDNGANPSIQGCQNSVQRIWDNNFRGGVISYSEGAHDWANLVMMFQKCWDPKRTADDIAEELCRYYFGEQAAPVVKELFYEMDKESVNHIYADREQKDYKGNPKIQDLVAKAENSLPDWAKSSRQWATVKGRAGTSRTRMRQVVLMADFDKHWQRYQSLLQKEVPAQSPEWLPETKDFFKSVAANGKEMSRVVLEMDRKAYAVVQGNIVPIWPNEHTGDALEALEALEEWKPGTPLQVKGRWLAAYVVPDGSVAVADGWGNMKSSGIQAGDARMAIAEMTGNGRNAVIFLGADGILKRWEPSGESGVLAKGRFLTGPLAAGDIDGDGKAEVVVLSGASEADSHLSVVYGDGTVKDLSIRPSGYESDQGAMGYIMQKPTLLKTAQTKIEPHVVICDLDGDGKNEIVCGDRDDGDKLTVLDAQGRVKSRGPAAPAGMLAAGDLNADGKADVVYLDGSGKLAGFSMQGGVMQFGEIVKPRWLSSVVVADMGGEKTPVVPWASKVPAGVVYADADGIVKVAYIGGRSARLSDWNSSVAVGPGMVVGDYNADGQDEVCYLRRALNFTFPLATLNYVDRLGNLRMLPHDFTQKSVNFCPTLGPRASGVMRF